MKVTLVALVPLTAHTYKRRDKDTPVAHEFHPGESSVPLIMKYKISQGTK
jgi:hypothetical protein